MHTGIHNSQSLSHNTDPSYGLRVRIKCLRVGAQQLQLRPKYAPLQLCSPYTRVEVQGNHSAAQPPRSESHHPRTLLPLEMGPHRSPTHPRDH